MTYRCPNAFLSTAAGASHQATLNQNEPWRNPGATTVAAAGDLGWLLGDLPGRIRPFYACLEPSPPPGEGRTFPPAATDQARGRARPPCPGFWPVLPGRLWVPSIQLAPMWRSWEIPMNPTQEPEAGVRGAAGTRNQSGRRSHSTGGRLRAPLSSLGLSLPREGRRPGSRQ